MTNRYIELQSNGEITSAYLSMLRNGDRTNPSPQILTVLAEILEVTVEDFYQLNIQNEIALRSADLDEDGQQAILSMIKHILSKENDSN